jgi:Integrase core domain
VGRIMALNRLVYDDIPHVPNRGMKPRAGPHPYKATFRHQYWFIDGRRMDFALDGVHWWSLVILEGYSRTILAGMIAPTEATWVALMVLYTACLRYGAPVRLVSDSGGAYTSVDFEAVCTRLQIQHETIVSTQGESYMNWMETHFNIQRRLYDYQFSLTQTPAELEQRHQAFIHTYNTTAHQGLLKDRRVPPIPVAVLGTAKGRVCPQDELAHVFSQGLFPRTTNRHGCVTLHSYHFYVEAGLPQTQVLLWVSGEQLRAAFENVVLAEYHCRYDWRDHQVKDIHGGVFYPTRVVSPQGTLIPLPPKNPWWCIDLNLAGVGPLVSRPCHSCCSSRSCPPGKVGFIPHWRKGNYDEVCTGFHQLRLGDYRGIYEIPHAEQTLVSHATGRSREIGAVKRCGKYRPVPLSTGAPPPRTSRGPM